MNALTSLDCRDDESVGSFKSCQRRIVVASRDAALVAGLLRATPKPVGLEAVSVLEALQATRSRVPDGVCSGFLVDLDTLPLDRSPGELCRQLAAIPRSGFVALVATSLSGSDEADAYLNGADHVFRRPIDNVVLRSRLEALWRRIERRSAEGTAGRATHRRSVFSLEIDLNCLTISHCGMPLQLTGAEYTLLEALSRRPGYPVCREALGAALWGREHCVYFAHLNCHISRIRMKLKSAKSGVTISAIRNVGYVLRDAGMPPSIP